MKKWLMAFVWCQVALAQSSPEIKVYTYGSFASPYGPGPALKEAFEALNEGTVTLVSYDTSLMLAAQLEREGENSRADVAIGVDALSRDRFSPLFTASLIPYSYTCLSLVYDQRKIPSPPQSLADMASTDYSIVMQDPRTSTTGINFLSWLHHLDPTLDNLKALIPHILTYTKGWSQSYALFLKGEADFVLSYTTSPLYHDLVEKKPHYRAIQLKEGHICSKEYIGILLSSSQKELAQQFVDFVLSPKGQKIIAEKAWIYPIKDIPDAWHTSPAYMAPEKVILMEDININTNQLVDEWKRVYR